MPDAPKYPLVDQTNNFQFFAQATLGATGPAIAASLKQTCEQDYATLRTMFGKNDPPDLPFRIEVDDSDNGANHGGCADVEIYVGLNDTLRKKLPPAKMIETYPLVGY